MNRRQFLQTTSNAILGSGLLASVPAFSRLSCGPVGPGIRRCSVGITSDILTITAAAQEPQYMNQWCWAAAISMVFKYYGYLVPQEQIVTETWGGLVNLPGQPWQILANLNRTWIDLEGQQFRVEGDSSTANVITAARDLAEDMPLIIGTLNHAMVLTSMQYFINDITNYVQMDAATVIDPIPGRGRRYMTAQEWQNISFVARIRIL